ncbi:MAG: hypothetical protein L0Y54_11090 [Sporichthyaceae bacterium]|nr:hypothetical protein [Sporichthyaceae bacterium]
MKAIPKVGNAVLAQSAEQGTLPTLYAATAPEVESGDYIGPGGPGELRGYPRKVKVSAEGRDPKNGARLWDFSEQLTGIPFMV